MLVVQLLGSIDDLVLPDDDIDLITGHNFVYLDVPNSGHIDIIKMDDTNEGKKRRYIFEESLKLSKKELQDKSVIPTNTEDFNNKQSEKVTDVVFIIHGIRDKGYWTHKVARRIKRISRGISVLETETSSYGYFAMLPFILSRKRLKNVDWFMDKYVENRFIYPDAEFSFIGHSNGTYLLAKALEQYPNIKFKYVVFAGSVVSSKYDWTNLLQTGRVKKVLNYVASADWVVALLPKGLEKLFNQDVGGAGHDGFPINDLNFTYIKGGHGAAIVEENWEDIANFIVNGTRPPINIPLDLYSEYRTTKFEIFLDKYSCFAPLLWVIVIILLVAIGFYIGSIELQSYQQTILLLTLYVWSIYFFLTKF